MQAKERRCDLCNQSLGPTAYYEFFRGWFGVYRVFAMMIGRPHVGRERYRVDTCCDCWEELKKQVAEALKKRKENHDD